MSTALSSISCVVVDDHQMVLDLLVDAVSVIPGLSVVATATDVDEADRLASLSHVDLLIVGGRSRTGDRWEVVRTVSARHPGVKCIVISSASSDVLCPPDLLPFVVSVIDKADGRESLLNAIARVVRHPGDDTHPNRVAEDVGSRLTARQRDLFVALGDGLSTKELAKILGITSRTVETHRKAIARKLGVSGAALVRLAVLRRRMKAAAALPPARSLAGRGNGT